MEITPETNLALLNALRRIIDVTVYDAAKYIANELKASDDSGAQNFLEVLESMAKDRDPETLYIGAAMYAALIDTCCGEDEPKKDVDEKQ